MKKILRTLCLTAICLAVSGTMLTSCDKLEEEGMNNGADFYSYRAQSTDYDYIRMVPVPSIRPSASPWAWTLFRAVTTTRSSKPATLATRILNNVPTEGKGRCSYSRSATRMASRRY